MPSVNTSIDIAAPPSLVREVFLDWAHYDWSKAFLKNIEVKDGKTAPVDLKEGDQLKVTTVGMGFDSVVGANTPAEFKWCGSLPFVFTGTHKFEFTPSPSNANETHLVQSEVFTGLLSFLVGPTWSMGKSTHTGFAAFNEELKAEAERRQAQRKAKL